MQNEKNQTLFLLFLCTTVLMMQAQQVTISPIPQTITWGAKAFNNTTSYFLTGSETADQDAVDLLKSKLNTGTIAIEVIIGEKDDPVVANYVAQIPDSKEGYYLSVSNDTISNNPPPIWDLWLIRRANGKREEYREKYVEHGQVYSIWICKTCEALRDVHAPAKNKWYKWT